MHRLIGKFVINKNWSKRKTYHLLKLRKNVGNCVQLNDATHIYIHEVAINRKHAEKPMYTN